MRIYSKPTHILRCMKRTKLAAILFWCSMTGFVLMLILNAATERHPIPNKIRGLGETVIMNHTEINRQLFLQNEVTSADNHAANLDAYEDPEQYELDFYRNAYLQSIEQQLETYRGRYEENNRLNTGFILVWLVLAVAFKLSWSTHHDRESNRVAEGASSISRSQSA